MKTPNPPIWALPDRFATADDSAKLDWTDLLDAGESVVSVAMTIVRGNAIISDISTVQNMTTFRLTGGAGEPSAHEMIVVVTSDRGDIEPLIVTFSVIG